MITKHRLIAMILADGNKISVYDGEDWQVKKSTSYKAILDAVESVDEAQLRIWNNDGTVKLGWVHIVNGLAPDEEIADHTINDYMNSIMGDFE